MRLLYLINIYMVYMCLFKDCPLKLGGQRGMKALVATAARSISAACDERNFSSSEERASAPLALASQRSPLSRGGILVLIIVPPPPLRGYSSYPRRRFFKLFSYIELTLIYIWCICAIVQNIQVTKM